MAKTVFFTVLKWNSKSRGERGGKKTYCQTMLDLLGKSGRATVLELDDFNPAEDSDEIRGFVALFEPSPANFSGRCQIADEKTPGLPTWAKIARGRVLIGAKAVNSPGNMVSCVEHILDAYPPLPSQTILPRLSPKRKERQGFFQLLWKMLKNVSS